MSLSPCIKNLPQYKKGCPRRIWSETDKKGCPCWIEFDMKTVGGQKTIHIAECIELYKVRLLYANNCLLEGNQQAIESFRNGMVVLDNNGKPQPKNAPATVALFNLLENMRLMSEQTPVLEIKHNNIKLEGDFK